MLTHIAAVWLIALTASPFTAPFSTCDLASLLGHPTPATARHPPSVPLTASANDAAPPILSLAGRGRVKLFGLSELRGSSPSIALLQSRVEDSAPQLFAVRHARSPILRL
jgi:hypothetical protein